MSGHDHISNSAHTRRDVLKGLGALGAMAVSGSVLSNSASAEIGDSAVYQYYHTDWSEIESNLQAVAEAGYDAIQVPPAQFSRIYKHEREYDEYTYDLPLGYQPIDFRDFDSEFGTEDEYESMVEEAHSQGLDVIADAVMNHVAAGGDTFERQVSIDDIPQFDEEDLHQECEIDYSDEESVEDCWLVGLRDLDQDSSYVRGQLKNYLEKYADLGVDGVRFDAAKHMSESFFKTYANQWADELDLYRFGEVLSGSLDTNMSYANTGMSVTDFALYFVMREEVFQSGGDMTALEDAGVVNEDPDKALTFVSNHDKKPPEYERLAYAYVLTYEGYPRVYNHRIDVSDSEISTLVSIRRNHLYGEATTRYIDSDLYVYERGDGLIAINIGGGRTETVETSWSDETLRELSGNGSDVTTNGDGSVSISVDGQSYAIWTPNEDDGDGDDGDSGDDDDDGSDDEDDTSGTTLQIEAPTADGESVYFTGSTDGLTSWGGGVEGTTTGGDTWEVTLDVSGSFEWKVRRGPSDETGDVWESGDNHTSDDLSPSFNGWSDGFEGSDDGDSDETTVEDGATYAIQNAASGRALDVSGVSTDNGANVHVWDYLEGDNQHWTVKSTDDGYYTLTATHSGKVLDVSGGEGATQDGADVHQWDYVGGTNQQFSIESVDGGVLLRARHSDKVVEAMGTDNGSDVQQQSEHGGDSQVWTLERR